MGHKRERVFACIIAIAGWYLIYPPATYTSAGAYSHTAFSQWSIDGSYGTVADCDAAHDRDLNGMQGLKQSSADFLQTRAGECIKSYDPRLAY